jgi:PadR family transcriptional regulator, regulatory protein AphA
MSATGNDDGTTADHRRPLTTTSYAVLGLLAVRSWTTYELTKQMEASMRNLWPRAERKIYDEPKKLVEHGLATVTRDTVGKRPRAVYAITPAGRRALRDWLDEPGALASLEFEALVKVVFAEQGDKRQLLDTLRRIRDGYEYKTHMDAQWADHYLRTGGQFPDRLAIISVAFKLQSDLNRTFGEWARWALAIVDQWPDDLRQAPPAQAALEEIRRRGDVAGPTAGPPGAGDWPYPPDLPERSK